MRKPNNSLILAAKTGVVLLLAGAAMIVLSPAANATSYGNAVFNCEGVFWHTAWGQQCVAPGAGLAGNYKSTADCSVEQDPWLIVTRSQGSTTRFYGPDCTYLVRLVTTGFIG